MKVANFFTYTLIFCCAWIATALWSWGGAQALSRTLIMPWVSQTFTLWPSAIAYAIGGAMAILGALFAAAVLLVVLLALEAGVHLMQRPSATLPS